MLRSAAKNFESVWVIVDPDDYGRVLASLEANDPDEDLRRLLAGKVYAHTASYDSAIAAWFAKERGDKFPETIVVSFERAQKLRYGENPGPGCRFLYGAAQVRGCPGWCSAAERSFPSTICFDLEGALLAIDPYRGQTRCAIVKHTSRVRARDRQQRSRGIPKGAGLRPRLGVRFGDRVQRSVDDADGRRRVEPVRGMHRCARVQPWRRRDPRPKEESAGARGTGAARERHQSRLQACTRRRSRSGTRGVDHQRRGLDARHEATAHAEEYQDLLFAWRAVASVKSNAIVLVRNGATIGIGAGQMSRVDAAFIAVHKANQANHITDGSVLGSDAFFPFRDGIDQAAEAGVRAIVQPGGSVRDAEVIAAADERGMAMIFTGKRQFRH
jgi:phosphoribosylaminoimidazolecarboxamide formyltransferase/IMP cyclohydrolase